MLLSLRGVLEHPEHPLWIRQCIIKFSLQTYGHDKVSILDGGLPMWIAKGYPTVSGPQPAISAAVYKANFLPERYRTMDQIKENLISKKEQVMNTQSHHNNIIHVHALYR